MRLISLVFIFVFAHICNAGIVYDGGGATASFVAIRKYVDPLDQGYTAGQTFTTGSTAGALVSVTLYLMNPSSNTGTINVQIRTLKSSGGLSKPTLTTLSTSGSINVSTISGSSAQAVTFSGFSGSLLANTSYGLVVGLDGLATNDTLNVYYGSSVSGQNSYKGPDGTYVSSADDLAGTVYDASAAVPEPSTFILFSLAIAAAGTFAYLKRRKPNTPEDISASLQLPS